MKPHTLPNSTDNKLISLRYATTRYHSSPVPPVSYFSFPISNISNRGSRCLWHAMSWVTSASTLHANNCLISVLLLRRAFATMGPPEGSIGEMGAVPSEVADSLHKRRSLSYPHAWDFNVVIGGRFSSYLENRA